jgi:regulatory protein
MSVHKKTDPKLAKEKLRRYCAYQERCHSEVRQKLISLGVFGDDTEEIISYLIVEGFLNEERFAKIFAGGKFRMKKWGRLKIVSALEKKGVSRNCIKAGLKEIDEENYLETLTKLLSEKLLLTTEENLYVKRDKLSQFAIQRGFEPELVWTCLKELCPD